MAGFECTDQLNCFGNRVDFLKVTGHLDNILEDYQNLSPFNIKTVREGIRWSVVERTPYNYDWTDVRRIIENAVENDIQVVWDMCHFGFPDDLSPLHPMFARRFARLCKAFVKYFRNMNPYETLIITPINEVSFLSWLGGEVCGTSPYCRGYGWEVKYALVKAYIEAIEAIREADNNVRIMITEPLVNIVPPSFASDPEVLHAAMAHEEQFQVLNMLTGKTCPELNGKPEHVDIIGCNYYHNNQWNANTFECLPWANENNDPRWRPLSSMLIDIYERYGKPIVLSETSHPGEHKAEWFGFVSEECGKVVDMNVPLWGICWYPIIDRPDWDHLHPWHKAGLWDVEVTQNGKLERVVDPALEEALLSVKSTIYSFKSA